MAFEQAIAERVLGKYPLSVASSLALEAACGVHDDFPVSKAPVLNYTQLWMNIRTLYRNLVGSIDRTSGSSVVPELLAQALTEEIDTIADQIREVTQGKTQVIFYYSNYSNLERRYANPIASLRQDTTPKQKEYTLIHNKTVELLLQIRKEDIRVFDLWPEPREVGAVALICTNYAFDLLARKEFSKLTLLESHTGQLKDRALWYTKFNGGQELSRIPFREDMLQVFGDSTLFKPADIRLRRELMTIAERYNWTSVTTLEKIKYGIDQIQNPYFKETLRSILVA